MIDALQTPSEVHGFRSCFTPLGNVTEIASQLRGKVSEILHDPAKKADFARARYRNRSKIRYELRDVLWDHSQHPRQRVCGRRRLSRDTPVELRRDPEAGIAHGGGLRHCGRWDCPVCGPKIAEGRRAEIEQAMRLAIERGHGIYLSLFTLPHTRRDRLRFVRRTITEGFRFLSAGRGGKEIRVRFEIVGNIRALETTHGKNGWHPHLHVLYFTERPLDPFEVAELEDALYRKWAGFVEKRGHGKPIRSLCRIDEITDDSGISAYLAKSASYEIARSDLKTGGDAEKGKTPFELLDRFRLYGDLNDLRLWHEWETEMAGVNRITWSKGLKARFGIAEESDAELAERKAAYSESVALTDVQWDRVRQNLGSPRFPGLWGYILDVAGRDGLDAAVQLIDALPLREKRLPGPGGGSVIRPPKH